MNNQSVKRVVAQLEKHATLFIVHVMQRLIIEHFVSEEQEQLIYATAFDYAKLNHFQDLEQDNYKKENLWDDFYHLFYFNDTLVDNEDEEREAVRWHHVVTAIVQVADVFKNNLLLNVEDERHVTWHVEHYYKEKGILILTQ